MMGKQKDMIIYGAGRYAAFVYRSLWLRQETGRILCFAVTQMEGQPSQLYGVPVRKFDEVKAYGSAVTVILAMKQAEPVKSMLMQEGIEQLYVVTPDIMQTIQTEWKEYLESLPIQRNKIVFSCFGGKGYECNCKYIAEELLKKNKALDLVWGVEREGMYQFPEGIRQAEYNSPAYEAEVYSAAVMVSNMENAPKYKRRELYFINTWHGTGPFKKARASLQMYKKNTEWLEQERKASNKTDLCISNSADNSQMFRESFLYEGEILECGNPRNDLLFKPEDTRSRVLQFLGIPTDKKIVLYAPTFRETIEESFSKYTLDWKKVLPALEKRFGDPFVLLYRFHQKLRDYKQFEDFYSFAVNVTMYPDVMELVVAADVLVTDYSSIMWDFSLQKRPVFLYHNDEREYTDERDFYWPVSRWPYIKAHSSEEMCEKILGFDEQQYLLDLEKFFEEDPSYDDGHAAEKVTARILDVINHPEKYGKD